MERRNKGSRSVLIFILIFLYVLSPVDAAPGPIDDILVMMLPVLLGSRDD